jgi:molybdenum cofactor biosynthesis enzyme MoaA
MKLEDIGFYTLSDARAKNASVDSPLQRCELILTDKCNFNCPYCRGVREDIKGTLPYTAARSTIRLWSNEGLKNIRFSGGEPTLYKELPRLVKLARIFGVKRIAISTNGSASLKYYKYLIKCGVNDISISLDACCASYGDKMCGIAGAWAKIVANIKALSNLTYVTVGIVFTEETKDTIGDVVNFASGLGVADIRVIPAAQYSKTNNPLQQIEEEILDKHPILKYRVKNFLKDRNVRGIQNTDTNRCPLVLDDMAVAQQYHFPCIIYLREGGETIGVLGSHVRVARGLWEFLHDTHIDPICKNNCLDVCIDYNNKVRSYHEEKRISKSR